MHTASRPPRCTKVIRASQMSSYGVLRSSSRSAIHPIRCGASVMCLPSMSKRIGIPSLCYGGRDSEQRRAGAPRCCRTTTRHTLSIPSHDNILSEEQDLYQSWMTHYNHVSAVWHYM